MSGTLRIGRFVASLTFLLFSLSVLPSVALADPLFCVPGTGAFSMHTYRLPMDDWKKLSRSEFGPLPILPAGSALLVKGTELNIVVDLQCLQRGGAETSRIDWLRQVGRTTTPSSSNRGSSPSPPYSLHKSYRWILERDWDFLELQAVLETEPCVFLASPESRFYINQIRDPLFREQVHLSQLKFLDVLPEFMPTLLLRKPVTIAVVDTGVDLSHPDLRLSKWINRGEVPGNARDDDQNGYIDDYNGYNFASEIGFSGPQGDWPDNKHGTHVAGLAAARFGNSVGGVGVNGVAKIMSLNVFGPNGFTRSSILENAIRYAGDQKADVINLSLGGREYSRTMRSALEYAISRGSLIVTAAGNDGIEICDDPRSFDFISPAVYGNSINGMIVTGSTDVMTGHLSLFSNYSKRLVEIAAPGAYSSEGSMFGLLSTTPGSSYGYLAGTSMSAPVLSGAAALAIGWLKSYNYTVTPQRLEAILKESSKPHRELEPYIQDGRSLDLVRMVRYLKSNYPER